MGDKQTDDNPGSTRQSCSGFRVLRTLALVVAGLLLALIAFRYYRQMALIERIEQEWGGWVLIERTGPEWLRRIIGNRRMQGFDTVTCVRTGYNDELNRLSLFTEMTELEVIECDPSQFRCFQDFKSLETLRIWNESLNDSDLAALVQVKMPNLRKLYFERAPDVTNRGIALISKMPQLEELKIPAPHVTDAGLDDLANLRGLEFLELRSTFLTNKAIEKLQRSLPDCYIRCE